MNPERRMALHVITQAVADALGHRRPQRASYALLKQATKYSYRLESRIATQDAIEARQWLFSEDEHPGSYRFWCRIAALDPDGPRRLIELCCQGAIRVENLPAAIRGRRDKRDA